MCSTIVFIATSLDGYIADKKGGLDWLETVPNPDGIDMGYGSMIRRIDAIIMGRRTFETVCSFQMGWPYDKPVFVLSTTLDEIPEKYRYKAELVKGAIPEILGKLHLRGHKHLYVDGGSTIQGFLQEDLIDELIITTIPVLLGGGTSLFTVLPRELRFTHLETKVFLGEIVQSHYKRLR